MNFSSLQHSAITQTPKFSALIINAKSGTEPETVQYEFSLIPQTKYIADDAVIFNGLRRMNYPSDSIDDAIAPNQPWPVHQIGRSKMIGEATTLLSSITDHIDQQVRQNTDDLHPDANNLLSQLNTKLKTFLSERLSDFQINAYVKDTLFNFNTPHREFKQNQPQIQEAAAQTATHSLHWEFSTIPSPATGKPLVGIQLSTLHPIEVPRQSILLNWPMDYRKEADLYKKMLQETVESLNLRLAPHTLDALALFAVISRLFPEKNEKFRNIPEFKWWGIAKLQQHKNFDINLERAKLFAGEPTPIASSSLYGVMPPLNEQQINNAAERKAEDFRTYKADRLSNEGLDGISPSLMRDVLTRLFYGYRSDEMIHPKSLLQRLDEQLKEADFGPFEHLDFQSRQKLREDIQLILPEYERWIAADIRNASIDPARVDDIFTRYMAAVRTQTPDQAQEKLLNQVAQALGNAFEGHNEIRWRDSYYTEQGKPPYQSKSDLGPLYQDALAQVAFWEKLETVDMERVRQSLIDQTMRQDPDLGPIYKRLTEEYGYDGTSAMIGLIKYFQPPVSQPLN